ncbi:hypothetical protein V1478_010333 [Vespula squamosa]|uniref:Uncharacterized protein n=1 Tax=Vespula squamosa TaxID=30214 RepID=A0ABD2AIE0_VESSQ
MSNDMNFFCLINTKDSHYINLLKNVYALHIITLNCKNKHDSYVLTFISMIQKIGIQLPLINMIF